MVFILYYLGIMILKSLYKYNMNFLCVYVCVYVDSHAHTGACVCSRM